RAGAVRPFVDKPFIFHPQGSPASMLEAIVESSDDAIFAEDLDGTILSWNRGAERLYGYTAVEAIGRSVVVIVPPDRRGEVEEILGRIRSGQRVEQYETTRIAKEGRRIDVALSLSPIIDAAGAIVGASVIARDISMRKSSDRELRESEEL